jgi:hypothetical protein
MTPLEIKAVNHCLNELKEVSTTSVYLSVNAAMKAVECSEDQKKYVLDALTKASQENVRSHVNNAHSWLTELAKP